MPKPPKKTQAEKSAENFFQTTEKNIMTTEKEVKEINPTQQEFTKGSTEIKVRENIQNTRSTVSKTYSKPSRQDLETIESGPKKQKITKKKATLKKEKKTVTKKVKTAPEEITLKKDGYELIITEKPQAAAKIATALGTATQRMSPQKVPYYEVDREGKKLVVACAVGHLFTLKQNEAKAPVPTFDVDWVPNFLAKKGDFTKRYYDTLLALTKNAREITVATDFDNEGEVIGINVVRFICRQKDANRMKFSTLTKDELNNAYENKFKTINWGQATAGIVRHYLDWYYGINLSRALMNAIKTTGKFKIMSIGRVQGPTLKMIVDKEKEISAFKSDPYWNVFIKIKDKEELELKHTKDIFDKKELKEFENLTGKDVDVRTEKSEKTLPPNAPFNLTELQKEAYNLYGFNPSRTLQIAQGLYLSGLISYPRTSSQKLPEAIGYKEILKKLADKLGLAKFIKRATPIEGKKEDPAHPSIYPTGIMQELTGEDEKLYNLIVRRFIALFCEDAVISKKRVIATKDNKLYDADGQAIKEKGWLAVYPTKTKEKEIPDFNGKYKILDSRIEEKETQPPRRYSPASILTEMEKLNLGTKATRASILETLYDRGYIKEQSIEASHLGVSLIDSLEKYSPIIVDINLTKDLQDQTDAIMESESNYEPQKEKILEKAKETIIKISKDFEKNEKEIGKELMDGEIQNREEQKKLNELCPCKVCNKGKLAITFSPRFKSFFIACNAYPECRTTYSLPPGNIKKTEKICDKCGFPMLMRLKKGKKPWIFCFNKICPSREQKKEPVEEVDESE